MIEVIFTIDYEIYGNGQGSLTDLVLDPMSKLKGIFKSHNKRLVVFVEAAEFEMIEKYKSDPAIDSVKKQIRQLYEEEFEIGLHLHPQWYNAKYINKNWELDYQEYNLCVQSRERIIQIIDRSVDFFQRILNAPEFIPISFRAGNWLFQPTKIIADVLSSKGVKIDTSVFKGGLQCKYNLDYRRSLKNGNLWKFSEDVNIPETDGNMIEIPIYTQMVPFWMMLTRKRVALQRKGSSSSISKSKRDVKRYLDFLRPRYPLKLDFCKMALEEMISMMDKIIKRHERNSAYYWPVVAIGHTKDILDFKTVDEFLMYLEKKGVEVTTFKETYKKIITNVSTRH